MGCDLINKERNVLTTDYLTTDYLTTDYLTTDYLTTDYLTTSESWVIIIAIYIHYDSGKSN